MDIKDRGQFNPSKASILVVDDTPTNLTLLVQMLSGQGYKVRVAPNGKLALASVQSNPPDLILLDVSMPDMDGYTVCQQLKKNEQTRNIPVIFISAFDSVFNKVNAFTVGGLDYITKPFELVEVLARIQNQLRLRQFQQQLQTQNAQLQLLLTTTQAIAEATDVNAALRVVLEKICQTIGLDFGEAWMRSSDSSALQCCGYWYSELATLQQLGEDQRCGLGSSDLPEQIWASRQLIWIDDVAQDGQPMVQPSWIETLGLKVAFGIPIQLEEQMLAVLIFFCRKHVTVDSQSLELVKAVATQLGTMIRRKEAEAALREANQALERLANLDGLTQVANRRRFDAYLAQEWSRSLREQTNLALILFDVDYFKAYNDCYGHLQGDECLQHITQAVSHTIKRPTDLLARYGGEEFVVLLPNTHTNGAIAVAQTIQRAIQQLKISHAQSKISDTVTLSLGVASLIPTPEQSPDDLIARADAALYDAKSQGRDRIGICDDRSES
ncbi:diguanylate cyclase [filamentous cyanobacterium CCP2]|nr:diguanylate cyclase [filamentous cyanobacterium CCP2]